MWYQRRDINSIIDHKVSFLTDTQCQFLGVCQYIFEAEKRKCICDAFFFKVQLDSCDHLS